MDRKTTNYLVYIGLAVTFAVTFVTGVLKFRYLMYIVGIPYFDLPLSLLTDLHDWTGTLMGILILVHLVLHREWVIETTRSLVRRKA